MQTSGKFEAPNILRLGTGLATAIVVLTIAAQTAAQPRPPISTSFVLSQNSGETRRGNWRICATLFQG